jgi:hypothetical protein
MNQAASSAAQKAAGAGEAAVKDVDKTGNGTNGELDGVRVTRSRAKGEEKKAEEEKERVLVREGEKVGGGNRG